MNARDQIRGSQAGRFQWGSYGFLAGILVGIMMGWLFAGFIGAFVRMAMVAMVVVPLVLIFIAWRKLISPMFRPPVDRQYQYEYMAPGNAIETRAVVHGSVVEPRAR